MKRYGKVGSGRREAKNEKTKEENRKRETVETVENGKREARSEKREAGNGKRETGNRS